jgi:hypothetical protein
MSRLESITPIRGLPFANPSNNTHALHTELLDMYPHLVHVCCLAVLFATLTQQTPKANETTKTPHFESSSTTMCSPE